VRSPDHVEARADLAVLVGLVVFRLPGMRLSLALLLIALAGGGDAVARRAVRGGGYRSHEVRKVHLGHLGSSIITSDELPPPNSRLCKSIPD